MDVNFSQNAFSPPRPSPSRVKTEPGFPSLSLDTHGPSGKRGSRQPTASPATPFASSTRALATTGAAGARSSLGPAGDRNSSVAPSIARADEGEYEGEAEAEGEAEEDEQDQQTRLEDEVFRLQQEAQARAKANLKVLMDHFSEEQQTRYDWYRRSTLNKGNVRKLIQSTGAQVTPQVAQMVAGVGKVFVGEIVERAIEVQTARGEHGPLAPEHLRQAYQMYKDEKGHVGAARPLRGKRMAL